MVAWLVAAFRPIGPYPVLDIEGEQGSAKSTTGRVLRALVDPNKADLRTVPRDERDLMIAAHNGWVVAYDNLSGIPLWLSDALCRLSTGGGFSTRELYTDTEEILIDVQRPIIINGIDAMIERGDLQDRTIPLVLPQIPSDRRRDEKEFWREFEAARPRLLGAVLDIVSVALGRVDSVRLARSPRMEAAQHVTERVEALRSALKRLAGGGAYWTEKALGLAIEIILEELEGRAKAALEAGQEEGPGNAQNWRKN
mgnify:FL=1